MEKHFNIISNKETSNNVTTLWTFQNKRAVHQLLTEGELTGNWSYVFNSDKASYMWILNQMELQGIQCNGNPPIWAFHSCDGYKSSPSVHTARALYAENAREFQLIKFNCPNSLIMLTSYSGWCEIFFKLGADPKSNITSEEQKYLFELYPETDEEWECHDIQATIPYLKKEWVIEIIDLEKEWGCGYWE
ncbi:hypothetical protein CN316_24800 [Bacillus cereus]|nr:hypothetical protein CN316_24800 [Bacillus cereus]